MHKLSKGEITRQALIIDVRNALNENGISLTYRELSSKLGVTIGRITNHFPTKDNLFVALSENYEIQFNQLIKSLSVKAAPSLTQVFQSALKVMDLQYEYRCIFMFIYSASPNQHIILNQVSTKWKNNLSIFTMMISGLVKAKILDKSILRKETFEIFRFQHINLLTTWLISFSIYDKTLPLTRCKKVYAKGVMMTFYPYLTKKGKTELVKLLKSKLR